jgi:hypothetical protein
VGAWWPAQRLAVIGLAPLDLAQYYRRPDGSLPDYFAMRAADLAESLYANNPLLQLGFGRQAVEVITIQMCAANQRG